MRRRNREINIFNMSLLDILCGALGAFCFMMIALLPYYKPPGTEEDARENQKKVAETMQQIDEMKKNISDPAVAEDLRKLVEELRRQIQEMQGQLNLALDAISSLSKENDALKISNAALTAENEQLKEMLRKMTSAEALAEMQKRIDQLEQQLQQAAAETSQLREQNGELTNANRGLRDTIESLAAICIYVNSDNPRQTLDIFLEDYRGPNIPSPGRPFDPIKSVPGPRVPGDLVAAGSGRSIYIIQQTPKGRDYRLFVKLTATSQKQGETNVFAKIAVANQKEIQLPRVTLHPSRPWLYYGILRREKNGEVIFKVATDAERDALWESLPRDPDLPAPASASEQRPELPEQKPIFDQETPPRPSPSAASTSGPISTPPPPPIRDREIQPSAAPKKP